MAEWMFQENEELLTEKQIEADHGETFDLPNYDEGTYRHLTNWHLSLPQSKINRRVELPSEPQDLGNKQYVLCGRLVAFVSSGTDVDVRLDDLVCWAIDRDSTLRGIWVQTTSGIWYLLKEPCQHQAHVDLNITVSGQQVQGETVTGTLPAQVEYHIEYRAKLGLISNLADIFLFDGDDKYLERHSKKPAKDLHEELLPAKQMLAKYPERASEPFDLELLKRYPLFVFAHFQDLLPPRCKFLTSLKNATGDHWTAQDFIASAEAAEARGARYPWGQPRADQESIDSNWVFDCRLEDANKKSRAKRTTMEIVAPAKKAARVAKAPSPPTKQHISESRAFGRNPKEEAKMEKERIRTSKKREEMLEKATYNSGRMEKAIAGMKAFLFPQESLLGTNTLEDVIKVGYQFANPDKALGYTQTKIRISRVKTWEHRVLVVMVFAGAAKEHEKFYVQSKFFVKKGGDSAALILCETWRKEAEEFVKTFVDIPIDEKPDGAGKPCELRNTLVDTYLRNIADLVKNCTAIDTAQKLDQLAEKGGVNWEVALEKMSEAAQQLQGGNLALAINEARGRLLRLRSVAKEAKAERMQEEKKSSETTKKPFPPKVAIRATSTGKGSDLAEEAAKKKIAMEKRREVLKATLARKVAMAPLPAKLGAARTGTAAQRASLSTTGSWSTRSNATHEPPPSGEPPGWGSNNGGSNSGGWGANKSSDQPSAAAEGLPPTSSEASGPKPGWGTASGRGWGANKSSNQAASGGWGGNKSGNQPSAAAQSLPPTSSEASGPKSGWGAASGVGSEKSGNQSTSGEWGGANKSAQPSATGQSVPSASGGGWVSNKSAQPSAAAQSLPPTSSEASGPKSGWGAASGVGWAAKKVDNQSTSGGWGGAKKSAQPSATAQSVSSANGGGWGGKKSASQSSTAPQTPTSEPRRSTNGGWGAKNSGRPSAHENSPPFGDVDDRPRVGSGASLPSTSVRQTHDNQLTGFQERKRGLAQSDGRAFQSRENQSAQRGYKVQRTEAPSNWSSNDQDRAPELAYPRAQSPLQQPAHDTTVGIGRGRGRGKFSNLPAWMTKKGGDNLGSAVPGLPLQPAPTSYGRVTTNPTTLSISPIDNDALRNIARMATSALPAMAGDASTGGTTETNANLQLPNHGRMPAVNSYPRANGWSASAAGQNADPHNRMPAMNNNAASIGVRQNPLDESMNRSRGRGRGRDQTKPAWMTRQQKP